MRINWQGRIGRLKFSFRAGLITRVVGINSTLKDGSHIIMWEFDNPDSGTVLWALEDTADHYDLSSIYVARSHPGGGFHAYCFHRCTWMESLHIVSGTANVDPGYINMSAMRGHWTLRLSDKGQGTPEYVCTITSLIPPTADVSDLVSLVKYEAWPRGQVWEIGHKGL